MNFGIGLTKDEWSLLLDVLRCDLNTSTDILCDEMAGKRKLEDGFRDYLVYRACHVDKIMDKIEEQLY